MKPPQLNPPIRALLLALVLAIAGGQAGAAPAQPQPPEIATIQVDAQGAHVSVRVPEGVQRIVIESTRRNELSGWTPRAVRRLDGKAQTVVIDLPADAPHEVLRVRADDQDPVPAGFYSGKTNIAPTPLPYGGSKVFRNGVLEDVAAPNQGPVAVETPGRAVVESDIWKVQGNRLYFFNQFRGLQVIDVTQPDAPRLTGSLPFAAAGEQLYVPDDRHAVLLLREDCRGNGFEGAAIAIVDVSADQPREITRLAVPGRLFESRMIGSSLYVASQTYENTDPRTGIWQMSTVLSSFDLSQPGAPVARSSRRIPGAASVVSASDRYFFVGQEIYRNSLQRTTELHILDASAADGTITEFTALPLTGLLRDKFKLNLRGDILRVVVEDQASPDRWSPITRLTTWRLSHSGDQKHELLGKLDLGAGENLFGTRFDGDRAYVVTYRRVDPLFIVDLSDPARPRILSELKIPGWSNYLHPLGDRLLTVGIDDTDGWRAAVQLFDVADPAQPSLLAKIPLGDSWSSTEANWDEKALGVFPTDGLVLLPFTGSSKDGTTVTGVQAIDLGRDTLKARGIIESEAWAPRRSAIVGSRVLSLSSRELLTADLTDRDTPKITSRLELSRPVDRLIVAGDHFLTFHNNQLQVAAKGTPESVLSTFELGKYPVLGASRRGDVLYLLQGIAAEVTWNQEKPDGEWIASTNSGLVQLRLLSLAALPKVSELGEVTEKHQITGLSEYEALWPSASTLVWASIAQSGYWGPWIDIMPMAKPALIADARFAWPGRWWGQPRTLLAFDTANPAQPAYLSTVASASGATGASTAFRGDGLVLFSEEFQESTITGTNEVVWTEYTYEERKDPSGNIIRTGEPIPHLVTNWFPVIQWWQRHELRVVDYNAGGREPVVRPSLPFPGELRGVTQGGSVLFSLAQKSEGTTNIVTRSILEVSAYDGVQVYVGDALTLATQGEETASVQVTAGGNVVAATGVWNAPEKSRLRVFGLDQARLTQIAEVRLAGLPQETRMLGDTLLVREAGPFELWDLQAPGQPQLIPSIDHGCIGFDLQRATGSPEDGWWAPGGEYGALRLGPK